MGNAEYSRMIAEGRIHDNFRRSHRWQKAMLGVALSAGALAGAYDEPLEEPYTEPLIDVSVAVAASLAASASRISTRRASAGEVEQYAVGQNHNPQYRHYETTIIMHEGEIQAKREYNPQAEVSASLEENLNSFLAPFSVYAGATLFSVAATNEHARQLGETVPMMAVGALIFAGGVYLHERDKNKHDQIEHLYERQLDNIDDGKTFAKDYIK